METGSSFSRSLQTIEYRQDAPDWSTGFRPTYPLGNNSALGDLAQAQARTGRGN